MYLEVFRKMKKMYTYENDINTLGMQGTNLKYVVFYSTQKAKI
jgi:hypothetical protein